jgi:hypothetical protein
MDRRGLFSFNLNREAVEVQRNLDRYFSIHRISAIGRPLMIPDGVYLFHRDIDRKVHSVCQTFMNIYGSSVYIADIVADEESGSTSIYGYNSGDSAVDLVDKLSEMTGLERSVFVESMARVESV